MFFNEKIAQFHILASSAEEVIEIAANELYQRGVVKKNFLENVLKRENEFPTGLNTGKYCVAIPHTDSDYVNRSQIEFVSLKEPVYFKNMANHDEKIPVTLVFMIAMSAPHEQAETLTKLMEMFSDQVLMKELDECDNIETFKNILQRKNIK